MEAKLIANKKELTVAQIQVFDKGVGKKKLNNSFQSMKYRRKLEQQLKGTVNENVKVDSTLSGNTKKVGKSFEILKEARWNGAENYELGRLLKQVIDNQLKNKIKVKCKYKADGTKYIVPTYVYFDNIEQSLKRI